MKTRHTVFGLGILLCVGLVNLAYAADPGRFIKVSTSGEMFLDYALNISGKEEDGETTYPNGFEVGRVYVNLKSTLSDKVAVRYTTDVDPGIIDNKGYGIRVKYAYADLSNIFPMTKLTFGLQGNLWTGMADKAWGYRVVSKSLFDQYKALASADIGLGATVSIPEGYGELVLQALNGGGYKQLETNQNKAIAARLLVTPVPKDDMLKNLGVAGFVYMDKDDDDNSNTRFGGLAKFSYQMAKLVGEFGMSQTGEDEVKGMGFAVSAEVKAGTEAPMSNLAIIARLDSWDKDTDSDDNEVMRVIGGLSYGIRDQQGSSSVSYSPSCG